MCDAISRIDKELAKIREQLASTDEDRLFERHEALLSALVNERAVDPASIGVKLRRLSELIFPMGDEPPIERRLLHSIQRDVEALMNREKPS